MSKFHIDVGSDQEHEDLVAEIYCNDEYVGVVTQENGLDFLKIEIPPRRDSKKWEFDYEDLISILNEAKRRLFDLRRS